MNELKFVLSVKDILNKLSQVPYKIFIRARGLEIVGIITKIEHRYDSAWGIMRRWVKGITLDGKIFEEPIDRKNKRTGELEDIIQMQNNLVMVTARNSSDPDDDNEENFQYFINPHQANEIKDQLDSVKEKDRIIYDLKKRYEEAIKKLNEANSQANVYASELNSLRDKVRLLSERLAEQTQRAEDYKRQLKEMQIGLLREESKLDERLKVSPSLGHLEGKDSAEIIVEATKKQIEARKELDKLGLGGLTAYATKEDLNKLKNELIMALKESKETVKEEEEKEEKRGRGKG